MDNFTSRGPAPAKDERIKTILLAVLPLLLALISIFVLAKPASSVEFHAKTIAALDEKHTTVMELTAASTAASAAITLIPGDTATPIANKLADLSSYFLLVVCAIFLEKYLVTITGYAAFYLLFPAACLCWSINVFARRASLRQLAVKLALFGLAIVLVIPASVRVSQLIETTYSASIQATLDTARQTTQNIQDKTAEEDPAEKGGLLSGFIDKVSSSVSDVTNQVKNVLNNFIEALAVLLVTSCVIPILVLAFFVWLVKLTLGLDLSFTKNDRL